MEAGFHLKLLLQLQLASDLSAATHLPYIISSINSDCFNPSPHLTKWTTRIHSLLHSKEPAGRWAGLCLAQQTSILSKDTMIEYSHSWISIVLPILSRKEPLPILKAVIRLLLTIFSTATNVKEFQRQVSLPNVPKFTSGIVGLVENHNDIEMKKLCILALAELIPLYPTLYRASHSALSNLALRYLDGNAPNPLNEELLRSSSRLYATLHLTGGKVAASNLWKKSMDDTLTVGWTAFSSLRSTYNEGQRRADKAQAPSDDPLIAIPYNLDRLRCTIVVLRDLLSTTVQRSVQMPLGRLIKFIVELLSCTVENKAEGFIDSTVHAMEVSFVPTIWKYGCDLLSHLSHQLGQFLTPNLTKLLSILTHHLETKLTSSQRLSFLQTIYHLHVHCHILDSPFIPTRLAKAVLPYLCIVLPASPKGSKDEDESKLPSKSKKGKKRNRNYEGDEIFEVKRGILCRTSTDGEVLLASLDVMQSLLQNPNLSVAMQSIVSRVLLAIVLALPQISPDILSSDTYLHTRLQSKALSIATDLGSGTTSVLSKNLPLVIKAALQDDHNEVLLRSFDVLLHPRVPPRIPSMLEVESISLFVQESHEEKETRETLGIALLNDPQRESEISIDSNPVKISSAPAVDSLKHVIAQGPPMIEPVQQPPEALQPPSPTIEPVDQVVAQQTSALPKNTDAFLPASEYIEKAVTLGVKSVEVSTPPSNMATVEQVDDEDEGIPEIDMDSDSEGD